LYRCPFATARRRDTARCQCPRDAAERFDAVALNFVDHREHVARIALGDPLFGSSCVSSGLGKLLDFRDACRAPWPPAGAADVRALMISRSCSVTAAKMSLVNLFACGLSTAMNSTPESMSVAINAKFRDKRSSLAITSLALCRLQIARAFSNSGLSLRLPLSISVNSAMSSHRLPSK
jgi:hypothetical protein